jgi:hypothetical protein
MVVKSRRLSWKKHIAGTESTINYKTFIVKPEEMTWRRLGNNSRMDVYVRKYEIVDWIGSAPVPGSCDHGDSSSESQTGGGGFLDVRATCNFSGSTLLQKDTDLKLNQPIY